MMVLNHWISNIFTGVQGKMSYTYNAKYKSNQIQTWHWKTQEKQVIKLLKKKALTWKTQWKRKIPSGNSPTSHHTDFKYHVIAQYHNAQWHYIILYHNTLYHEFSNNKHLGGYHEKNEALKQFRIVLKQKRASVCH